MDWKKLDILVNKYQKGETTIQEERELKRFILNTSEYLPEKYSYLNFAFEFYNSAKKDTYPANSPAVKFKNKASLKITKLSGVAAVLIILILLAINHSKPVYATLQLQKINYMYEKQVYNQTKEALLLVAQNLNRSTKEIKYLDKIHFISHKIFKNDK